MMILSKDSLVSISVGILLAILLRHAPGRAAWEFNRSVDDDTLIHGSSGDDHTIIRFLGGDDVTLLSGRLYRPLQKNDNNTTSGDDDNKKVPIIVLAHGLGLSQDCHLHPFVNAFTRAGFAAFTFDYASFGASDGYPRHVVHQKMHVADVHAAITMIQKDEKIRKVVDVTKIGLWGTSLGGGHVLEVAASSDIGDSPKITAVVAQVPALISGIESVLGTIQKSPFVAVTGMANLIHGLLKGASKGILGQTWYIPLHGVPGSAAIMQNPGDNEGYSSLIPQNGGQYDWKNAASSGSVVRLLTHRPMNQVSQIQTTPTLLVAAENDTLCPAKAVENAAKLIGNSELLLLRGVGHFDVYHKEEVLQTILSTTVDFFKANLK
mmetsp:Transcript_21/g.41  ORF Transcript_21/g.41 Transcript_21/m.41 type:complete len:378 (+) Transcript_21:47-1180(+)